MHNIVILGFGSNQRKFLKYLDVKNNNIIILDKKKLIKSNIYFYKINIHNHKKIYQFGKKILKRFKNIDYVLYRSSGATIISAHILEKIFKIRRLDSKLQNSIYSKSYFLNFLKRNKIKSINSYKINKIYNTNKIKMVIKSDSPKIGKKFTFLINNKVNKDILRKVKNNSFNNKFILSRFYHGRDISTFYLVDNKRKLIKKISDVEEINIFKNGSVKNLGVCSPVKLIKNKILIKKNLIDKKIINKFKNYFGILSITSKINSIEILPYEINAGLSGDDYADKIYPSISNNSLYRAEINISLFGRLSNVNYIKNKFCGILMKKKIENHRKFYKLIKKYK